MKNEIGQKIKRIRISKGIDRLQLAEHIGLSEGAFGKIERGETRIDVERLQEISNFLKEPINIFIDKAPNAENNKENAFVFNSPYLTMNEKLLEQLLKISDQISVLIKIQK